MILDAHVHIWELPPIAPVGPTAPTWNVPDPEESGSAELLLEDMDTNGVHGAILVQSSGATWDNTYIAQAAKRNSHRFRSIGLVDPLDPNNAASVCKWMDDFGMSGFRFHPDYYPEHHILTLHHNHAMFLEIESRKGIVKVHNRVENSHQLAQTADKYTGITWIIDHMMYPEPHMAKNRWQEYQPVLDLANHDNVHMMISDVHNRSDESFPFTDMHDAVKLAIDAFGIERCLWGTGYPGYHREKHGWLSLVDELRLVRDGFNWLTESERDALLGNTAAQLHRF